MIRYPRLAGLDCEECHKHFYEIPSGVPSTYDGEDGLPTMQERGPESLPPCENCPKGRQGVADFERNYMLSEENLHLVELFQRSQSPGFKLPPHLENDPLFLERYAVVRQIVRECESEDEQDSLRHGLAQLILRSP